MFWSFLSIILFLALRPFLFFLIDLKRKEKKRKKEETLRETLRLLEVFAFKRARYKNFFQNRKFFISLYLLILIVIGIIAYYKFFFSLIFIFFFNILWILILQLTLGKRRREELEIIDKFLTFKKKFMGFIDKESNKFSYSKEFSLEWDESNEYPSKILLKIPVDFSLKERIRFLENLSINLGKGKVWKDESEDWSLLSGEVLIERKEFLVSSKVAFVRSFLELKKKLIGKVEKDSGLFTYESEFVFESFDEEDYPNILRVKLPIGFNLEDRELEITREVSKNLGRGRSWELGELDKERNEVLLKLLPSLPDKALWDEEYIFNERVSPYYFPLGLTSKGGILIKRKDEREERILGYDPVGDQWEVMKKLGIVSGVATVEFQNSPQVIGAGETGGGKSVLMRNIENSCLMRPKNWFLMVCDMKRVEGGKLKKFGVPVGQTFKDCAHILSYIQMIMLERYEEMEEKDVVDYKDIPEEERGPAIMVIVDEAGELLSPIKGTDEASKEVQKQKAIALQSIESIYRLGRAAMVHIIVFSQRIAEDQGITMAIRQNASTKIAAGPLAKRLSQMVFESDLGSLVPSSPRGRVGLMVNKKEFIIQGFFAKDDYLKEWLEKKNGKGNYNLYENNELLKKFLNFKEREEVLEKEMTKNIFTNEMKT